jgi:hypothetical protein
MSSMGIGSDTLYDDGLEEGDLREVDLNTTSPVPAWERHIRLKNDNAAKGSAPFSDMFYSIHYEDVVISLNNFKLITLYHLKIRLRLYQTI